MECALLPHKTVQGIVHNPDDHPVDKEFLAPKFLYLNNRQYTRGGL